MSLNKEELSAIKTFIQKKGIKYLDVQMEIIDHVASGIEVRMAANKNLTFEEALKQTHASFGIFGFGGVEDSIINTMSKKFNKVFWKFFFSFFGIKYVFLVFFAGILFYRIMAIVNYEIMLFVFMLLAMVFIGVILITKKNKKYNKFLSYRLSGTYLAYIGSLALISHFIINHTTKAVLFGLDLTQVLGSIVLIILIIYIASAFKTMVVGKKESEMLMKKHQLLGY